MSKSVNYVFLLGNLTKDIESRYTTGGKAVSTMNLATNERTKKDGQWIDVANYHTVILWDKLSEVANNFLKKGNRCAVSGRIVTRSYDKDGQKRYATEIIANDLILLEGKPSTSEPAAQSNPDADESPF